VPKVDAGYFDDEQSELPASEEQSQLAHVETGNLLPSPQSRLSARAAERVPKQIAP
jgi:hypothetical protein